MFTAKTLLTIIMVAMVTALPTSDQDVILTGQHFSAEDMLQGNDDIDNIFQSVNLVHKPHLNLAPPMPNFQDDVLANTPSEQQIADDSSKLQSNFLKALDQKDFSNPDMDKLNKMTSVDDVNPEADEQALNRENPKAVFESIGAMPVEVPAEDMQQLAVNTVAASKSAAKSAAKSATKPPYIPSKPIRDGVDDDVNVDNVIKSEAKSVVDQGSVVAAAEKQGEKMMETKKEDASTKKVTEDTKNLANSAKTGTDSPKDEAQEVKKNLQEKVGKKESKSKDNGTGQMAPQVCIMALAAVAAVMVAH